ncbi:MAG: hypothetical protein KME42_28250 [Tildeniella nuda ZEHNDER 1965/U140]|jgi:hypothetical protein|nr:hypothetical protein [Tildeniella nuda ZEHNDER 1965/U140]
MTLNAFLKVVQRLSNSCFVRHWLHWNYPANPPVMAIAVIPYGSLDRLDQELSNLGFKRQAHKLWGLWIVERTSTEEDESNVI